MRSHARATTTADRRSRAKLIARRYASGATLEEVGTELDLTRERVRQILIQSGYRMSKLKASAARARRDRRLEEYGDRIRQLLGRGKTPSEVAAELHVPLDVVREIDSANPEYARERKTNRRRPASKIYAEAEILACLRLASTELGGVMTTADYTAFARGRFFQDGRPWPTHQTVFLRFGSWRAGLETAGLPSNPSTPISGKTLFDAAHCIDAIREVDRALGHLPTVHEYETYARQMGGALPSSSTVRHRLGRWPDALRAAAEFGSGRAPGD